MSAARLSLGWWVVVAVLATGCGTASGHRGSYRQRAPGTEQPGFWGADSSWGGRNGWQPEPDARGPRVPEGWPEEGASDEEVLAPLLACASPAEFLQLQSRVNMAELVKRLGDWSAVRLGALGPVDVRASQELTRKRAAFLLSATEDYGPYAEVFALFILHTAFDDEVRALLRQLAGERQLVRTLGEMKAVRAELEQRRVRWKDFPEREEQAGDVLRGARSAARDVLSSTQVSGGGRYLRMTQQRGQLPPVYQQALDEVEQELIGGHYSAGNVALGSFDQLTFGVPLGFYHLAVGTGHGVGELAKGQYEQATRELAPAVVLVAAYAGGKAARGWRPAPELRLEALRAVTWRLQERLGVEGPGVLARYVRGSREAAVFVGVGGEPAAEALYEARGNVARAQAWLSQARPGGEGVAEPRQSPGPAAATVAALVDEAVGHTPEVVQAKLIQAEAEAAGLRLPAQVEVLRKLNATLGTPPPGVPEGDTLWSEYVSYREGRLGELEQGSTVQGPLRWEPYERMRGAFARGLAFERSMVARLRADAGLPVAQRRWLKGFQHPRIETNVGVAKEGTPGVRFVDVLVIEQQPPAGQPPRVETFSFKSRNLEPLEGNDLRAYLRADASAALKYYGETLDVRRPSLQLRVRVHRVRLVYQGGALKPQGSKLKTAMDGVQDDVPGVEVLFQ